MINAIASVRLPFPLFPPATYPTTKSPRASSPAATPALRHLAVAQKNAQRFKHPGSCLHVAHMPSQTTALQTLHPHITLRAMESDCLSKRTDDGAAHVFNTGGDGSNQDGALCTRFSLWGIVPLHNNLLAAADNLRLLWDLFPLTLTFCSCSFALIPRLLGGHANHRAKRGSSTHRTSSFFSPAFMRPRPPSSLFSGLYGARALGYWDGVTVSVMALALAANAIVRPELHAGIACAFALGLVPASRGAGPVLVIPFSSRLLEHSARNMMMMMESISVLEPL
ncbi:hypothetical protein C8J57DRAFT_1731969 [Mycena rebaudengoi]|nr:hypothetical protein C8J57DRAFT_1731969 [Mycena rebaudengoi]